MTAKQTDYRFTVDSTVAGIPCKLGVTEIGYYIPATYGRSMEDSEPEDSSQHSYEILDRKGYRAAWLDAKCSKKDEEQHQLDIDKALEAISYGYY